MVRLALLAVIVTTGCGRINFDPPGGGGDGDGGDGTKPSDAMGPGVMCVGGNAPQCPNGIASLFSSGSQMSSGTTLPHNDNLAGSCGGAGGHEYALRYNVQQSGTFVFTTQGSDYDTVLYVRDGGCTGAELACNDDFGGATTSQITLSLTAGQSVVVVVDGANGLCGNYVLRTSALP